MSNIDLRTFRRGALRLAAGLRVGSLLLAGVCGAQSPPATTTAPATAKTTTTPTATTTTKSKKLPPPSKPMDLNSATSDQLQRLPGVGPVTAQRILDYRKKSGPFQSVDDLLAVRGISTKRLEKIRQYVMVKTPGAAPAATPSKTPPKKQ